MSIEVIDDFLPLKQFKPIEDLLMGSYFPWFYNPFVVHEIEPELTEFQFVHAFYRRLVGVCSPHYDVVKPCVDKLKAQVLIRCKSNLNPVTETPVIRSFHTDTDIDCKTAIYYVNSNNGCTIFEDGTKIESVANRMLIFDTSYSHTGITCTDTKTRVLINFNYI